MNNFRTHKIIAFFLAVLMILPLIPAVDLTVFAEGNALALEGEPVFAPMDDTLATINKNEITVYYGYENGNTGITASGVRGAHIYLTQSVSYNGTIVLYEVFTTDSALIPYINSQYKYVLASDVNLGGDPLPEETTTAPETTITPETTPEETTTAPETTTTPETPVTPSLTLDFLPAGLIAESETVSGTATINGTSVVVYKSLDNGAAGVAISVVSGTQVTLVTKYTFTTAEGAKLVFYRYDYNGDNTDLANAAISETGGYPFIYAGSLITTPVPTEKTDSATGVKINADLPEGVALTVTPKQLAEVGLNTNIYPVGASSLFYDVTLLLNNAEYQPTNGITVTFPESAILASGIAVGDSYHVYHIHEGAVEMRKAAVYNGGDLALTFTGLSAVGIAETEEPVNMIELHGGSYTVESINPEVAAFVVSTPVTLYGHFQDSVYTAEVTSAVGAPIKLYSKVTYADGFEMYNYYYVGEDAALNEVMYTYAFISTDDVTFMDPTVPQIRGLINVKVRFLPQYQNQVSIIDYLYAIPGYKGNALTGVRAYDLPAVFNIVDTYYTSEDDVYFLLEGSNGYLWPGEYGNHRWVSASLLELVTINYTEIAPLRDPVVGQSMVVYARSAIRAAEVLAVAERLEADGVETKKIVVPTGNPGEYTVTLEVYVTGEKVTQTITEDIATDIILVLDQSGSMDTNDFKTITGYQVASGTASSFEDTDLYVKVGEEYVKVTVTIKTGTGYTYTRYTRDNNDDQNRRNHEIYNNQSELYYELNGEYWPIEVEQTNNNYTYYYVPATGNRVQIGNTQSGRDNRPDFDTFRFYTRSYSNNVPTEYTYSYVDANGVTQSETFAPTANITASKYYTATTSTITRLQALKNAVTAFAESVHEKAKGKDGELGTADDVKHRIAVVGFGRYYSNGSYYTNTELFVGSTQYGYNNYSQNGQNNANSAQNHYHEAFQNMWTTDGYNNVIASKNALDANGGTYVNLGIEMANGIFAANPVEEGKKRNRVVIVFTDGDPGYNGNWNGANYGSSGDAEAVADRAITNATTSKTTYGATVYTIGVFNGADAETRPVSSVSNGNRFMHYVSSNYSGGTSFDSPGTESFPSSGSYYLSANNTTDLTGIFKQISQNVEGGGATTELDEETVVRDIVAPNFTVPAGTTDIKFYTQAYTGEDTWGERVDAIGVSASQNTDGTTTTLDITGFDFSANYVGKEIKDNQVTGYRGKKLIIEFKINEDPDFLGGSNVDTNGSLSGIYSDGQLLEQFEQPKVNVGLKEISTIVQDKYIYYGNTTDLTGLLNLYVKRNDQQTDLRVTVDGINNAYVHLQYTIKLDDNTVAVYTILPGMPWAAGTWSTQNEALLRDYLAKDDTKFSITCVMTDAATPTNTSTANGSATVFVYKPTITFKDSVQEYKKALAIGNTTYTDIKDFLEAHFVKTEWKHGEDTVTPEGVEPTITYEFTYANMGSEKDPFANYEMNATSDVPVDVIATISGNTTPIVGNAGVTFAHQACDESVTCNYPKDEEEFIVHVINAITQLTIEKEGWNTVDPNQTFLFTVTGLDAEGQPINLTVTVHENGSVTIDGLIIGNEYTITEKTDWSWRYDFDSWSVSDSITTTDIKTENGAEIKLGETGNVITFTNTRINEYWLDGDSWCDNRFISTTYTVNN